MLKLKFDIHYIFTSNLKMSLMQNKQDYVTFRLNQTYHNILIQFYIICANIMLFLALSQNHNFERKSTNFKHFISCDFSCDFHLSHITLSLKIVNISSDSHMISPHMTICVFNFDKLNTMIWDSNDDPLFVIIIFIVFNITDNNYYLI